MRALSLLFAISLLAAGQAPPSASTPPANQPPPDVKPEDKCVIEGLVLNGTTGEPLKKAHVVLRRADNTQLNPVPYGETTGASGRFVLEDVDPGKYRLNAERNGFVNAAYGEKRSRPGSGGLLTLAPGQEMKDVVLHMTPQGVIAGRVLDEDGEPVARVNVQCLRSMYSRGEKGFFSSGGASTNDKGDYRVFGLSPGKYIVSASYNRLDSGSAERRKNSSNEQTYIPTFFPGVASKDAAIAVMVTAGAEVDGTDIKLVRARTVTMGGRVTNRRSQYDQVSVQLGVRGGSDWSSVKRTTVDPQGRFLFRGILPGSYVVRVDEFREGELRTAFANIEVADSDITGVQLTLAASPEISGKIQADGPVDFSGPPMRVQVQPLSPVAGIFGGGGEVKSDQTFKLTNIAPDRYQITVSPVPEGCYLKRYRWGDNDLPQGVLDLSGGATAGELTVVIGANAAEIDGSVRNGNQQPSMGARVVLIPTDADRPYLFKQAATDQNGRFTIKQITPGKYKLYAFDDLEPGASQDPEYMKTFESRVEIVEIREGAKESKDLLLISTDDSPAKPSGQ